MTLDSVSRGLAAFELYRAAYRGAQEHDRPLYGPRKGPDTHDRVGSRSR